MSGKPITRTHYIILLVLALIPLVMTLMAFPFLPDPLPAHFNSRLDVDRWGSRYEAFLVPAIAVPVGLFLIWATKFSAKKDDYGGKMMFHIVIATEVFLIAITALMLYMYMTG